MKVRMSKLVRDLVPERIIKKEMMILLKEKLQEEVEEFLKDETLEELADILEVLQVIYKERK